MLIVTPQPQDWDAFVRQHPRGHALQLAAWGTLKSAFGWSYDRVGITESGQLIAGAQVLFKSLPLRLGTLAYLPFGAYVTDKRQWEPLWQAIHALCRRHHAAFLKVEPGFYPDEPAPDMVAWGFRPSPQTIQPPNSIFLTLDDEAKLLARMNQGTRRKIRQSAKNGVHITAAQNLADVQRFTDLMTTTGTRNHFGVHDPAYYAMAFTQFPQDAALLLADHAGDTLAGVFVFAVGDTAYYLYGASSNEKRTLMGSYGVQWAAIQWALARGCRHYDLWGIPDADEVTLEAQFETREDGLWGVYGFKRGWGGQVTRSLGAWDYPYQTFFYSAYQLALTLRSRGKLTE